MTTTLQTKPTTLAERVALFEREFAELMIDICDRLHLPSSIAAADVSEGLGRLKAAVRGMPEQ